MDPTRILEIQPVSSNNVEINLSEMQSTIVSNRMNFSSLRIPTSTPNQENVDQSSITNLSKLSRMIKDQIKVSKKVLSEMTWTASKTEINGSSDSMIPVPNVPKGWDAASLQESLRQHSLKRKLTNSVLVSLLALSFDIPEEYLMLDMDKFLLPNFEASERPDHKRELALFPFSERTNAWIFERRRRADERHDLYYHHEKSNVTFRSTSEVVNFILYNAYPVKKQMAKKSALQENPLAEGSGTKRKTFSHRKQASSSSILREKSVKIQTEENLAGFKGDKYKNLPNSDKKVKPDNLDNSDSEATESDEDMHRARQRFQHPLDKKTKELERNERAYQPKEQEESDHCPSTHQALVNSGDGKQNKTVTKNASSEEVGDGTAIQTPFELVVMEKMDSVASTSNPVEPNTGKKGDVEDIFGQLGDLEDASIAVQVLSNQFNLGDDIDKDLCFY